MSYDLAETCVFSKQSLGPILCVPEPLREQVPTRLGAPLIPKLRGHVAEFLNRSSLDHLRLLASPTCVGFWYGHVRSSQRRFSRKHGINPYGLMALASVLGLNEAWIYLRLTLRPCRVQPIPPGSLAFSVPPLTRDRSHMLRPWHGNINPLSIAYAFRPRLRSRLTPGGFACPGKPWAYGEDDSHYPLSLLIPA